jgi:3-deoxy-D-manno-octulosonic-acid transferase
MTFFVPYILNGVYLLLLVAFSPYILWQAATKGKYREGFRHKILGLIPKRPESDRCVWLHGVSVGEINLLATVVRHIEQEHPNWTCMISTTTLTGMELARKRFPDLDVFYCPLDFSWAVRNAMRRAKPDILILGELELWPNLIIAAKNAGAKVAIINGRLSRKSFRGYRKVRPLLSKIMRRLDLVAVQSDTYAGRFHSLGVRGESIHVTGSLKFDGAESDRNNPATLLLRKTAGFQDDDLVFIAGSTQEPEESLALDAFRNLHKKHPELRLVLVPRHEHRFNVVAKMLDESGVPWRRRSELPPPSDEFEAPSPESEAKTDSDPQVETQSEATEEPRVLLVDTIGELGAWWGTASIAYVGGSMGRRGGQNMIEPAGYGAAVSFGPNTRNFRDIVTLMFSCGAAVVVRNGEALTRFVQQCSESPEYREELGNKAKALTEEQAGATRRTLALIERMIDPPPSPSQIVRMRIRRHTLPSQENKPRRRRR